MIRPLKTLRLASLLLFCGFACAPPQTPVQIGGQALEVESEPDATQLVTRFGVFDPLLENWPGDLGEGPEASGGVAAVDGFIVQSHDPVHPGLSQELTELGAKVRGFVPDNALWIELPRHQLKSVRALPWVRTVVHAPHLLKVDPRLIEPRRARLKVKNPKALRDAVVEVDAAEHAPKIVSWVESKGGVVLPNTAYAEDADGARQMIPVQVRADMLAGLSALPEVVGISAMTTRTLHNDRSFGMVQAGVVGETPIWDAGLRGREQIIAVADTGVYTDSCFFQTPGKIAAYRDWAGNQDGDVVGHGTHVAGSIAGQSNGSRIYKRHDGMAPEARLWVQDIAAGDELVGLDRDIAPLLEEAWRHDAHIHVDSWGDDDNAYGPDARTIDRFVSSHREFLVVVANGNGGSNGPGSVGSPATAKNIISVGAIDSLRPERVAGFSGRGPTFDGRIKPTLLAPGVNISSAMHRGFCRTQLMSGTSMAAPTLAGAAALVREYFTQGYYPTGHPNAADERRPTSALMRAVMIAGAESLHERGQRPPSVMAQGFGRVQLDKVLDMGAGARRLFVSDENDTAPLSTGEEQTFSFDLEPGGTTDVALVWTDPPALPGAGRTLVNDLDLTLVCDHGTYLGNGGGAPALPDAIADHINVEEVIHLPSAADRNHCTAHVAGRLVPMGPQNFALVVVGSLRGSVQTPL